VTRLLNTFQLIQRKVLIHAEIWMINDVVENPPSGLRVGIQQRLSCDAVCQQKDDAQQHEEHDICNLQHNVDMKLIAHCRDYSLRTPNTEYISLGFPSLGR